MAHELTPAEILAMRTREIGVIPICIKCDRQLDPKVTSVAKPGWAECPICFIAYELRVEITPTSLKLEMRPMRQVCHARGCTATAQPRARHCAGCVASPVYFCSLHWETMDRPSCR